MSFSLWCDFIENEFLDNEFMSLLYANTINGATSNPAIFKNAILNFDSYKKKIEKLKGKKSKEIYEILAIEDIQKVADKLALNYKNNDEGYISIELDPRLHDNTSLSIAEGKRLFTQISKDNVMIKIPATLNSYEVMYELLKNGISVNATLIFSPEQTKTCLEVLNLALKDFRKNNIANLKEPQAVISIFVSRFDRLLNKESKEQDTIGILNANLCYNQIIKNNDKNIKALFASTGVKGDDLSKDYYIKNLLFENSINTAPLDAIRAFKMENIEFKKALDDENINKIINKNINIEKLHNAYEFLLNDGLEQFCIAYEEILKSL